MRADIHDGREHMLQSEAGYIDARLLTPARQNLLQRTAGPYIRVRMRNTLCEQMFSASPPNSDIPRCGWHFAFVPATDSFTAANRVVNRSLRRRARAPAGRAVLHLGFPAGWVRAAGEGERHEDLQEQLKPPNGGVFLALNGIVIKSYRGSTLRISQTRSIPTKKYSSRSCTPRSSRR